MKKILTILAIAVPFLAPQAVYAHAFGKLYNLPVPFWMYLYGGAAAIVASFFIIGYFFNKKSQGFSYPTIDLSRSGFFAFLTAPRFLTIAKVTSVFLFVFTILTGLLGENSSYLNFNMTFFWIVFALGLTYATALIGNVYSIVNPWKVMVEWYEKLSGSEVKGTITYPKNLGYWPALIFYFLFIWLELFGQTTPIKLPLMLIHYTLLNAFGVFTFGKENWFRYGEFFSVFFRLIGKIAPVEYRSGKLYLRPPLVGLLKDGAEHFSLLLFVLFMLSSTAFDGFKETRSWIRFFGQYVGDFARPVLGNNAYDVFQTIGLLLSPLILLAIYLVLIALTKAVAKSTISLKDLSLQFAFSLIPIAFVYNIAHYYTLIFTEGPNMVWLISDPLGYGWDLFKTADYSNSFILSANFVWHSQVAFILLGHIAGVYLAHLVALNVFTSQKRALLSQLPTLILMVTYTMIGLWILSQPITGGTL